MVESIGRRFLEESKHRKESPPQRGYVPPNPPPFHKADPPGTARFPLPAPQREGGPGLWDLCSARRTLRNYAQKPISLTELSQLLWAAQGVTGFRNGRELRAAPSAGRTFPLETYVVVHLVDGLEPGLYHYGVLKHDLGLLRKGDFVKEVSDATGWQEHVLEAAVVFIWAAVIERTACKYGERAYRYIHLDAGHAAENLCLAGVGLGMGCCVMGAFFDDEVNRFLGIDGQEETAIYLLSAGKTPQ